MFDEIELFCVATEYIPPPKFQDVEGNSGINS